MTIGPLTIIFGVLSLAVFAAAVVRPRLYLNGHPGMKLVRGAVGEGGTTVLFVLVALMLAGVGWMIARM